MLRPVSFTSQCASPCLGATVQGLEWLKNRGGVHQDCHLNGEDDDDEQGDVGGTHFQTEAWFLGLQVRENRRGVPLMIMDGKWLVASK